MRPRSIVRFELLYAAAIGVGLVTSLLGWAETRLVLIGMGVTPVVGDIGLLLGLAIPLLLLWLVARRASDVARWVIVLLVALALLGLVTGLVRGTYQLQIVGVLGIVRLILQIAAVALTFRPDAQAWLTGPADPVEVPR